MDNSKRKNDIVSSMMEVEYSKVLPNEVNIDGYKKIHFTEIMALGAGLSSIPEAFRTITQTVSTNGGEVLYRAIFKDGVTGTLASSKDGIGKLGTILKTDGGFAQARFQAVPGGTTSASSVVAFNPAMIFLAATLMNIGKELTEIRKTQEEMFDYLQEEKRAQQKGDLSYLEGIMKDYKHNWDNDLFKTSRYVKVQDIKNNAMRNIIFYNEQINKSISKKEFIIKSTDIKNKLEKLQLDFTDYQIALYIYGLASFLDVILLENFDSDYLNDVIKGIQHYANQYREIYTKCYNDIERSSSSSLQSFVLGGLANAGNKAGNVVAKIPVVSKSQIDENLVEVSEKLEEFRDKITEKTMDKFANSREDCVYPFIKNIKEMNRLYNQPMEILFDDNTLFIKMCGTTAGGNV